MKFQSVYQSLNERQKQAVDIIYGAVLIIAGPGTGKTQLLASRIAQMLQSEAMIAPQNILCLTYTNAGAIAMRKRLESFIGATAYQVEIGTFHSFCNDIVMKHPDRFGVRDLEPVSPIEAIEILYRMIDNLPNDHLLKRFRGDIYYESNRMQRLFQMMKEEGWSPEFLKEKMNEWIVGLPENEAFQYKRANKKKGIQVGDPKEAAIEAEVEKCKKTMAAAELFENYNKLLLGLQRYDFSDMLHWVINKFEQDKNFLFSYQERFQFVLVDEFQDTSGSQMRLLDLLMNYWDQPNVFVVGDDDQALYEFNGARIANLIEFQKTYNPKVIVLDKNYRSDKKILDPSAQLIKQNLQRLINFQKDFPASAKDLQAMTKHSGEKYLNVNSFDTPMAEETGIFIMIRELLDKGIKPSEIAVLYRKHKQSDRLIRLLRAKNIPVMIRRDENVLENKMVSQLINILILLAGNMQENINLFFQVLHYPYFNLNIADLEEGFIQLKKDRSKDEAFDHSIETISRSFNEPIRKVMIMLQEVQQQKYYLPFLDYVRYVMDKTGLLNYVYMGMGENSLKHVNAMSSFFNFVKSEVFRDPLTDDGVFLDKIFKMVNNNIRIPTENLDYDEEGVVLSTVHSAKGLEWDYVFMMGVQRKEWEKSRRSGNKFYIPMNITLSVDEDQLESNRRLFYVAMTRARKGLTISYHIRDDNKQEQEPTQFLTEFNHMEPTKVSVKAPEMVRSAVTDMSFTNFKPKVKERIIDESLDGMNMSVSAMNKYLQCPVAFYYENVVKVPFVANDALVYGNAIHIAMKNLYDHFREYGKVMNYNEIVDVVNKYLLKNVGQIGEQAYRLRVELAKKVIRAFLEKRFPESNKITLTEYTVKAKLNDIPFIYIFDKMEFVGNEVDCVDYKTGSYNSFKNHVKPPTDKEPYGGTHWRQGVFGKIMLDTIQFAPWRFKSIRFEVLDENIPEPHYVEVTPEAEALMLKAMTEVYEKIMNHEFKPGCGECPWCKMNEMSNI